VRYKIKVYVKEGRYKYTITDFRYEGNKMEPIEKWLEASEDLKVKYFTHLTQVDEMVNEIIWSLAEGMDPKVDEEEEW